MRRWRLMPPPATRHTVRPQFVGCGARRHRGWSVDVMMHCEFLRPDCKKSPRGNLFPAVIDLVALNCYGAADSVPGAGTGLR